MDSWEPEHQPMDPVYPTRTPLSEKSLNANVDDFSTWVSNHKKLRQKRILNSQTQNPNPSVQTQKPNGQRVDPSRYSETNTAPRYGNHHHINGSTASHMRSFHVKKKQHPYGHVEKRKSPVKRSVDEPKPGWNSRLTATDKIPIYDARKDRHLRHRRARRSKSHSHGKQSVRHISAYAVSPGRLGKRKKASKTHSPVRVKRQGWMEGSSQNSSVKNSSNRNSGSSELHEEKIKDLEHQLSKQQTDTMRMLDLKEHMIKQLKNEKLIKDKQHDKTKERHLKLKAEYDILKKRMEKMEKRLKVKSSRTKKRIRGSNAGLSKTVAPSPSSLHATLESQKQEIWSLNSELNMFKTQNKMLREAELEQSDNNSQVVIDLRKKLRIEQERVRRLKGQVAEAEKASGRVSKLRSYLEREKKEASKTQSQHRKLMKEFETLKQSLSSTKTSQDKTQDKINLLKNQLISTQQSLDEQLTLTKQIERENKNLTDKIQKLEQTASGSSKLKSTLQQQCLEKEEDIKRVARRLAIVEKEKSDLDIKHQQLQATLRNFESKSRMNESTSNSLESERNKLTEKNNRLEQEIKELKQLHISKVKETSQAKEELAKKLQEVNSRNQKVVSELKELREYKKNTIDHLAASRSELDDLRRENEKMKREFESLEDLKAKYEETTKRCSVLSESNALLLMRLKRMEGKS